MSSTKKRNMYVSEECSDDGGSEQDSVSGSEDDGDDTSLSGFIVSQDEEEDEKPKKSSVKTPPRAADKAASSSSGKRRRVLSDDDDDAGSAGGGSGHASAAKKAAPLKHVSASTVTAGKGKLPPNKKLNWKAKLINVQHLTEFLSYCEPGMPEKMEMFVHKPKNQPSFIGVTASVFGLTTYLRGILYADVQFYEGDAEAEVGEEKFALDTPWLLTMLQAHDKSSPVILYSEKAESCVVVCDPNRNSREISKHDMTEVGDPICFDVSMVTTGAYIVRVMPTNIKGIIKQFVSGHADKITITLMRTRMVWKGTGPPPKRSDKKDQYEFMFVFSAVVNSGELQRVMEFDSGPTIGTGTAAGCFVEKNSGSRTAATEEAPGDPEKDDDDEDDEQDEDVGDDDEDGGWVKEEETLISEGFCVSYISKILGPFSGPFDLYFKGSSPGEATGCLTFYSSLGVMETASGSQETSYVIYVLPALSRPTS